MLNFALPSHPRLGAYQGESLVHLVQKTKRYVEAGALANVIGNLIDILFRSGPDKVSEAQRATFFRE